MWIYKNASNIDIGFISDRKIAKCFAWIYFNLRHFLIICLVTDGDIMSDSCHAIAVNNFYWYGVDEAGEMLLRNSCCRRVYFNTNISFRSENVARGFHSHLIVSFSSTLRPRQDSRHFADDIFKCIFLNENVSISITISLLFILDVPIDNHWQRPCDKPLSEPMIAYWRIYAPLVLNELNLFPHVTVIVYLFRVGRTHVSSEFHFIWLET